MTVKEYLSQAYRIDQRINSKLDMLSSLNALATKVTSTLTDMPHSSSRGTSSLEDTICKIVDLQKEINADIDTLVDMKRDIGNTINTLESPELRMILEKRYISNKAWPTIAVELGYNLRHLYRLHDIALSKLATECHY